MSSLLSKYGCMMWHWSNFISEFRHPSSQPVSTTIRTCCPRNQHTTMPHQPLADTTPAQNAAIVTRRSLGMKTRQVAYKENISPSTVSQITNWYGKTSNFAAKGMKKGQECKMSKRDIDLACWMLSSGHCKNATDIKHNYFPLLHVDTIQSALCKRGLKVCTQQSKPLLTRKHKAMWLDWAERHCYWEDKN